MPATWSNCLAIVAACCLSLAAGGGAAAEIDGDALVEARRAVWEFERPWIERSLRHGERREQLRDSDEVQRAVRAFFAQLDDRAAKFAAIEMLDSRYVYLMNKSLAADLLGPLLRDADPAVQARAARAVGYNACGVRYADELLAMAAGDPPASTLLAVISAMSGAQHPPFIDRLSDLTHHADAGVRAAASSQLTWLAPPTAWEHNVRLLGDEQAAVRFSAIQNLARSREPRAAAWIAARLDDADSSVRERAVWGLGQLAHRESADLIARRLNDPHHHVRGRAAVVLGRLQAAAHGDAIAQRLADDNVVVRRYAVQAVGLLGEPRYRDRLLPLLTDADEQIQSYAAAALRQLDGEPSAD